MSWKLIVTLLLMISVFRESLSKTENEVLDEEENKISELEGDDAYMKEMMSMIKSMQKQSKGTPDPKVGKLLATLEPNDTRNADEMGTYMQGDMLMTGNYNGGVYPRWPNGVVPYVIEGRFNQQQIGYINSARKLIEQYTCIRFVQRRNQRDFVAIRGDNTGCYSSLGRTGGRQVLNLQIPGCVYGAGVTIHEMLHAIGIPHEHTRKDRDQYVSILFQNIISVQAHNFKRERYSGLGLPYDYNSIMHYSKASFSVDERRRDTIVPRRNNVVIGQRRGLSTIDIQEINRLYQCKVGLTGRSGVTVQQTTPRTTRRSGNVATSRRIVSYIIYNPNTRKYERKSYYI